MLGSKSCRIEADGGIDLVVVVFMVRHARVQGLPLDAQDLLDLVCAHVPGAESAAPAQHAIAVLRLPAGPRRHEARPWRRERPLPYPYRNPLPLAKTTFRLLPWIRQIWQINAVL